MTGLKSESGMYGVNDMMDKLTANGRFSLGTIQAIASFVLAAVISLMIPATLLESFITVIGLPEMIESSAPPLGVPERLVIAFFCGLVTAAIIIALAPNRNTDAMTTPFLSTDNDDEAFVSDRSHSPTFLERLRKFGFGHPAGNDDSIRDLTDLPKIRNADAHPDAPVRRPLFAGADLAEPSISHADPLKYAEPVPAVQGRASVYDTVQDEEPSETPETDDMPDEQSFYEMSEEADDQDMIEDIAPAQIFGPSSATKDADLAALSITELVDRLEQGLLALKYGATTPLAAPNPLAHRAAPDVHSASETVDLQSAGTEPDAFASAEREPTDQKADEMDAALKAALATLQRMASK